MNGRENKRQQERELEEIRSFRTSKRRKKTENKGMMKKSQNSELFYVCEKLKRETKQPSCNRKLKHFVEF